MTIHTKQRQQCVVADLYVHEWPGDGPTVLALPGLASSGIVWEALAARLADARVLSLDLRGRGRSNLVTGSPGLRSHARDVARVAEVLDLRDVVLVGHSMGAYLAPLVAEEVRGRVSRLVLVDGGVPAALPFFMKPALTSLAWRRNLRKAGRDWPDAATFANVAFGKALGRRKDLLPLLTRWMEYELDGRPGSLRPRLAVEHAVADAVDTFHGADVASALDSLTVPAHLVAAEHLSGDGGRPFLTDAVLARWRGRQPLLTTERVSGSNHVTVVFSAEVAAAVEASPRGAAHDRNTGF